jgi:hypothetical protein
MVMYSATIFSPGKPPIESGNLVLLGPNDARNWCLEQAPRMMDAFAIFDNGNVVRSGVIAQLLESGDD